MHIFFQEIPQIRTSASQKPHAIRHTSSQHAQKLPNKSRTHLRSTHTFPKEHPDAGILGPVLSPPPGVPVLSHALHLLLHVQHRRVLQQHTTAGELSVVECHPVKGIFVRCVDTIPVRNSDQLMTSIWRVFNIKTSRCS